MPKRKSNTCNLKFKQNWEINYFFILNAENKSQCLICNHIISSNRSFNISRHYNKKHEKDYGNLSTENRLLFLKNLKAQKDTQQTVQNPSSSKTIEQQCLTASYAVSLEIARATKCFSDGEIIKKCAIEMARAFDNAHIVEMFEQVSLSRRTVSRRINDINIDIEVNLKSLLQSSKYFSLCIDESTDISDVSQLCIFVRCIENNFSINEELLSLIPLHNTTRGIDIFNAVFQKVNEFCNGFGKCTAIVTDGAKAMVGKTNGFYGQLKKHNIHCPMLHCIIHQEALCGKMIKIATAMQLVVKVTNLIRGGNKSLSHRKFQTFLQELNASYGDIPLHCEVRWLSAGKCLNRFFALRKEIPLFLKHEVKSNIADLEKALEDCTFFSELAFLVDITEHLNKLNLKLQVKKQTISTLMHHINAFRNCLSVFKMELMENELFHFPSCNEIRTDFPGFDFSIFSNFVDNIITEFNTRFSDFDSVRN